MYNQILSQRKSGAPYIIVFLLATITGLFFSVSAFAENLKIGVKIGDNQARILFFYPNPTAFNAEIKGNAVFLKFDRPLTPDFTPLFSMAKDYVIGATVSKDGRNIVLALKSKNYKLRKFISDKFVGIDLIKSQPIEKENAVVVPKIAQAEPKKTYIEAKKPTNKLEAQPAKTERNTGKEEKSKKTQPAVVVAQAKQPDKAIKDQQDKQSQNLPPQTPANNNQGKTQKDNYVIEIEPINTKDVVKNIKWRFSWKKPVAAAVFYRAGTLWLVFDNKVKVDLGNIKTQYQDIITDAGQLENQQYTILYFRGNKLNNVTTYTDNNDWLVEIGLDNSNIFKPAQLISQYKSKYSKGIFFAIDNVAQNTLTFVDPVIGDGLMVVPLFQPSIGVLQERDFVDFSLLASAQGFVINPFSDNLQISIRVTGIEVLVPPNTVSEAVLGHKLENPDKGSINPVYSILPFEKWYDLPKKEYMDNYLNLLQDTVYVPKQEQNEARLQLARFYLGIGFTKESLGLLRYIQRRDANSANNNRFKLLQGVAQFIIGDYIGARTTLDTIDLSTMSELETQETMFWQQAARVAFGISTPEYNFLQYYDTFLRSYPVPLILRLAFLDMQQSIDNNAFEHAGQILTVLEKINISKNAPERRRLVNSIKFYEALYKDATGDEKSAIKIWNELAEDMNDQYYRTKSIYYLAKNLYKAHKISADEAIKKLNAIRMSWRGGDVEANLLKFLADLYYDNHDYINALRIWQEYAVAFPHNLDTFLIKSRMSKVFMDLFSRNATAYNLSPFQAVSLFYEFHDLLPIGQEGDDIIQRFAYELVKLDLLDQAEALLNHQVNYRLSGEPRSEVATKLAMIYLIDHKPQKVIETLDTTSSSNIPSELKTERFYLRVRALIDSAKYNDALNMLSTDTSEDAENLKARIFWLQHDCSSLRKLLEANLNKIISQTSTVDMEESEDILHLALCYVENHDQDDVDILYKSFSTRMPDSNLAAALKFIVEYNGPLNVYDLEKSLGIDAIQSFLDKYKKTILLPAG